MRFEFVPMSREHVVAVLGWRYEPPYDFYNAPGEPSEEELAFFTLPESQYYAALDESGALVGFCCFGAEARVPGGNYVQAEALDVGLGLRPDLTGAGLGLRFVEAILGYATRRFAPALLRLSVALFNQRAIAVYERAGFRRLETFIGITGRGEHAFLMMTRTLNFEL